MTNRRAALADAIASAIDDHKDVDHQHLRHVKVDVRFNPRNGEIAGVRVETVTDREEPGRHARNA